VEDLLTRLQASDRIRVVSRQSSHSYKDRTADARTIARELGCRYVVEGSVRKVGDHVRVTAQLIDAPADRHLWAERYDRQLQDAFALQDEICDAVVAAIEARIGGDSPGAAPAAATAPEPAPRTRRSLPGRWVIPALVALVVMAALLTWTLQQRGQERWAREDALPRLQALIAADDYAAAFDLAREIERVTPNDPLLPQLEPSFSAEVRLDTAPTGAKVYYRPYAGGDEDWRLVGETPLVDVAVPIGVGLWRLEKEGHDTALLAPFHSPTRRRRRRAWCSCRRFQRRSQASAMTPSKCPRSSSTATRYATGTSRSSSTRAATPRPTTGAICRSARATTGGRPWRRSWT
jgi:hypothetical protein